MFPPTQLSSVPAMAQRSTYVSCTSLHRNASRGGKKIPWVSNKEIALKTLSSDTAVFSQISKGHALWQALHCMCITYFHYHLNLLAGTCYLQTVASIKTFQFTRSTAPCEPAVWSPVFIEMAINNKNLQGLLTHIHACIFWIGCMYQICKLRTATPLTSPLSPFPQFGLGAQYTTKIAWWREGKGRGWRKSRKGNTQRSSFAFHC